MTQINYSAYLSAMKELMDAKVFELCPFGYPEAFIRPVVLYGETFHKCYSGGKSIDTIEQALDLYDLWKQYDRVGVVAWLAKRKGVLPWIL